MRKALTPEQIRDLPEHWQSYAQIAVHMTEDSLVGTNPSVLHDIVLVLLAELSALNVRVNQIHLRDPLDIQRAHDIMHAVTTEEIKIHLHTNDRASCHSAHDVLAWVIEAPCGNVFTRNLRLTERAAEAHGYRLAERPGPPISQAEREAGS